MCHRRCGKRGGEVKVVGNGSLCGAEETFSVAVVALDP